MLPRTDDPDNIQMCLNCTKPRCTNCLSPTPERKTEKNYLRCPVVQLDPKTKRAIAVYASPREASEDTGISVHSIYKCSRGIYKFAGGYRWTTIEPR